MVINNIVNATIQNLQSRLNPKEPKKKSNIGSMNSSSNTSKSQISQKEQQIESKYYASLNLINNPKKGKDQNNISSLTPTENSFIGNKSMESHGSLVGRPSPSNSSLNLNGSFNNSTQSTHRGAPASQYENSRKEPVQNAKTSPHQPQFSQRDAGVRKEYKLGSQTKGREISPNQKKLNRIPEFNLNGKTEQGESNRNRSKSNRSGNSSKSKGKKPNETALEKIMSKINSQKEESFSDLSVKSTNEKMDLKGKNPHQMKGERESNTSFSSKSSENSTIAKHLIDSQILWQYESLFGHFVELDPRNFREIFKGYNRLLKVSWRFEISEILAGFRSLKLRNSLKNLFLLEKLSSFLYCVKRSRDPKDQVVGKILFLSFKGFVYFVELVLRKLPESLQKSEFIERLKLSIRRRKSLMNISTDDVVLDSYTTFKQINLALVPLIQGQLRKGSQFLYNLNIFLKIYDKCSYSDGLTQLFELLEFSEKPKMTKEALEDFTDILLEEENDNLPNESFSQPEEIQHKIPVPMPLEQPDSPKASNVLSIRSTRIFERRESECLNESTKEFAEKEKHTGADPNCPEFYEMLGDFSCPQTPQLRLSFSTGLKPRDSEYLMSTMGEGIHSGLRRNESEDNPIKVVRNNCFQEERKKEETIENVMDINHKNPVSTPENEEESKTEPLKNEFGKTLEGIGEPIKEPFLPPVAPDIYTLVLDLDETLVHFEEIGDAGQFFIRPFANEFLDELSELYEIVIFTAAMQEVFLLLLICSIIPRFSG